MTQSNLRTGHGRLLAVGDIHGCAKPLRAVLDAVGIEAADTLVVLGDFINRGPDTRGVIEILLQAAQACELILIMGNHEEELLCARQDRSAFGRWLSMGGFQTLKSYGLLNHADFRYHDIDQVTHQSLEGIPRVHWQFVEQACGWWECDHFFFTHAGYQPDLPLDAQSAAELRWLGLDEWPIRPHCSGKTAIVGHTPNLAGRVVDFGFLRCLDTGCGLGGFLTAMDIESGQQWRCKEDSEKVIWE